jgi:hypothetical protein
LFITTRISGDWPGRDGKESRLIEGILMVSWERRGLGIAMQGCAKCSHISRSSAIQTPRRHLTRGG